MFLGLRECSLDASVSPTRMTIENDVLMAGREPQRRLIAALWGVREA